MFLETISDNDKARYVKYAVGFNHCIYKELEATFQANVDSNFPQKQFNALDNKAHKFDVCTLPQLQEYLKQELNANYKAIMLRFTFTDTKNRILNIEQLSLRGNHQPFPRNVRRLINRQNSLHTYWQKSNEFIEEWKRRYLLSTKQQQLYFWSYILSICSIMKYIEIEFSHQLISLPYDALEEDRDKFKGLDDSDLKRHKIDYQLWKGFFIPVRCLQI